MFDRSVRVVPSTASLAKETHVFHLIPASPSVELDGGTGRPRHIRLDGARLRITHVESVRDETAAYPAGAGPRTVFVVRAADRRFRLVHRLHERRWAVEDLGPGAAARLSQAA